MKKTLTAALAGAGLLMSPALAAPVTGGITAVEVTVDLVGAGVTPGLIGTATAVSDDPLTVSFPITGGDLDPATLAGTIEHDGSGLTLAANGTTVELTDFVIDTAGSVLSGVVAVAGGPVVGRVDIFTFDLSGLTAEEITDTDAPSISLLLTELAATTLADTLGIAALAGLAGAEFGLAGTAPDLDVTDPIPLPGAAVLFVTGAAAFAARRRVSA